MTGDTGLWRRLRSLQHEGECPLPPYVSHPVPARMRVEDDRCLSVMREVGFGCGMPRPPQAREAQMMDAKPLRWPPTSWPPIVPVAGY